MSAVANPASTAARPHARDRVRSQPRVRELVVGAAGLSLLLGLSLALRTTAIHAPFWIDEGLSVGIASHPFGDIPSVLRQDGSPPLYYLLLHLWMAVVRRRPGGDARAVARLRAARRSPSPGGAGAACSGAARAGAPRR